MTQKSKPGGQEKRVQKKRGNQRRAAGRARSQAGHGVWLYGTHAVRAALANPRRQCHRLLIASKATLETLSGEISATATACPTEIATREALEAVLPEGAVHQGIALLAAPLTPPDFEDIRADEAPDSLVLVLDQVTDPRNLGAILRSAAAFSASAVIVQDRHAPQMTGAAAKAASGAAELLPPVRVTNIARSLDQLAAAGFWRLGLDGGADRLLEAARPKAGWGRTALVLGAEGKGLRPLVANSCDELVRIAIADGGGPAENRHVDSLNVATAAAVAMYELRRAAPRQ